MPVVDETIRARAAAFVPPRADTPERVLVALSGGVDSAVAAWLMVEAGHEVIGVSLRLAPDAPSGPAREGRCCSVDDMTDARRVADKLGIPFYAIDARARFAETVVQPFVDGIRAGITPIPCLACNHDVKLGDLLGTARSLGARLATGHYARVVDWAGHKTIQVPDDRDRDQSYYLYGTPPDAMRDLLFPLGALDKPLVRGLAERAGLLVADKADSHEICFVPDGHHADVVERIGGKGRAGHVVDVTGKKHRAHDGVHRFTVGQRRGVGVGGVGQPLYVVDVDAASGDVVVGPKSALAATMLEAAPLRGPVPFDAWPARVFVRVRARATDMPARPERIDQETLRLTFEEPVDAIAPGQAAVAYDAHGTLLGGAVITSRLDGPRPRRTLAVLSASPASTSWSG